MSSEIEPLRRQLRDALSRTPDWISRASLQRATRWKEDHAKARKVLDKRNPTAMELIAAIRSVREE